MIPVKDQIAQVDELPGEEIQFGIGDPRWVMRTQADLYSDITTAIIREYSTNAYDANVMAGNKAPIQVTLPTMMNPYFTVKDEGVGMDLETFREVYTQFGVSDKRKSSATNGMLGYGSKSGVAYTDTFTVTSIKNGMKIVGVVMRKPDWSIVLKVVSHSKTDEPNGTEVVIPVHNWQEFQRKAHDFYKFWLPGRVLVDGKAVDHAVGDKIAENFYYSEHWNTSYVVMGNVPYRIANPDALFRDTKINPINFVAYVDNLNGADGEQAVEFTPSREDLKYTDHTKATLQKVINDFEQQIVATAKSDIDNAKTHSDAYKAWRKWTGTLGRSLFADLTFKGEKFVDRFPVIGQRYNLHYTRNSTHTIKEHHVESMDKTLMVLEFDLNLSSRHKAMVKEYINLKNLTKSAVIFTKAAKIDSVWVDHSEFVTWDEIVKTVPKPVRQPRSGGTVSGRLKGSFDYITRNGRKNGQPLPTDGDIYWISVQTEKRYSVKNILNMLDSDATVIVLGANRIDKFKRENPKVEAFLTFAKSKVVKDTSSLLSDEAKEILNVPSGTRRWIEVLDVSRLDDPYLTDLKDRIKNEDSLMKRYEANESLARALGMWYDLKRYQPSVSKGYDITKKYPLLGSLTYYNKPHSELYFYLNARYASYNETKESK